MHAWGPFWDCKVCYFEKCNFWFILFDLSRGVTTREVLLDECYVNLLLLIRYVHYASFLESKMLYHYPYFMASSKWCQKKSWGSNSSFCMHATSLHAFIIIMANFLLLLHAFHIIIMPLWDIWEKSWNCPFCPESRNSQAILFLSIFKIWFVIM